MLMIPKVASYLRSPKAVQQRQIFAQKQGNFRDFQPKKLNLRPPPFDSEVAPASTLTNGLLLSHAFDTYSAGYNTTFPASLTYTLGLSGSPAGLVAAKLLNGFNSNGTVGYGVMPNREGLRFLGGAFSFAFWMLANDVPVTADLITKVTANRGYILRLSDLGVLTWFTGNGTGYNSVISGITIGIATWYHVVVTCNSGVLISIRVSTEGAFGAKDTAVPGTFSPDLLAVFLMNVVAGPSPGIDVIFDEWDAWTRVITDAEAEEHWNNGIGKAYPFE